MSQIIPILSLVIAALAVIVGPFISWHVANRQIVAPMRQAWINELRKNLAKLFGSATFFLATGIHKADAEDYKQLAIIQQEIELTINPREEEHQLLVERIATMMKALVAGDQKKFIELQREAVKRSQDILKTEWNRVK